jgi:hypothetical protein
MIKRDFNITKRSSEKAGYPIMDVPHLGILRYFRPSALIQRFVGMWGIRPKAVVLPVTYSDGLLFDVEGLNDLRSPNAKISEEYQSFGDVVFAFANEGLNIYLLIDPTLQFVRTDPLFVVDIVNDSSPTLCLGNPSSREVIAAVLGTSVDVTLNALGSAGGRGHLEGIVMDLVNIWPMGATNQRLELTCFCPSCEKYFAGENEKLLSHFRDFPNPWNLLLKDSGTGISYIDEVMQDSSPDELVGLSRQKGFHTAFEKREHSDLVKQAELLNDYIRVRHEQTLFAVDDIFHKALAGLGEFLKGDEFPKRVLLLEGVNYGWTSGIQLDRLDRIATGSIVHPYDEVWFDPSSTDLTMKDVPFCSYMWKRSRYLVDAFLQYAASVSDPVKRATTGMSRLSRSQAKEVLEMRLRQALGTAMIGQTALFALPELAGESQVSQRIGFVGVALDEEIGKALIESISIPKGSREGDQSSEAA